MTVYHVRPKDNGQWEVKKRGADRASYVGSEAGAKAKVDKFTEEGDTKVLHNTDGSVFRRVTVDGSRERSRRSTMENVADKIGDGVSPFNTR